VLKPPLSQTVIQGLEEKPPSPGKDRAPRIRRYRGRLGHLAARDPNEVIDEMRGQ